MSRPLWHPSLGDTFQLCFRAGSVPNLRSSGPRWTCSRPSGREALERAINHRDLRTPRMLRVFLLTALLPNLKQGTLLHQHTSIYIYTCVCVVAFNITSLLPSEMCPFGEFKQDRYGALLPICAGLKWQAMFNRVAHLSGLFKGNPQSLPWVTQGISFVVTSL